MLFSALSFLLVDFHTHKLFDDREAQFHQFFLNGGNDVAEFHAERQRAHNYDIIDPFQQFEGILLLRPCQFQQTVEYHQQLYFSIEIAFVVRIIFLKGLLQNNNQTVSELLLQQFLD